MRLTFYLLDETVTDFDQALLPQKLEGEGAFEEIPLQEGLPFEARAYLQADHASEPKWLRLIQPHLQMDDPGRLRNIHNSLLLLIRTDDRFFAVSCGYGFLALDRRHMEQGFGLRTTLNAIDPTKIKTLDVRNIDVVTRQRRTSVNYDSGIADFDLNLDQDLVRFAAGQPSDTALGKRMQGADSLSWTREVAFTELGEMCRTLYDCWSQETYLQTFPFIDHLKEVRDETLLDVLDSSLREALDGRQTERLTLAYPELSNWDRAECYRIYQGRIRGECDEVDLEAVYRFLDEFDLRDIDPTKVNVLALDDDARPVGPPNVLYDYLVFETKHDQQTYVLTLSKWYRVADDYLAQIDDAVRQILPPVGLTLPSIYEGETEQAYNARCADENADLILFDRELVHLPGHSSIEACDLLSAAGHFINVKRQTRSATLSHLFAQGTVSLELLWQYPAFRAAVLRQAEGRGWALPFTEAGITDRAGITCVYAVSTKKTGSLCDVLPFFSKVNLRNHKAMIESMGYRIAACIVPIVPRPPEAR